MNRGSYRGDRQHGHAFGGASRSSGLIRNIIIAVLAVALAATLIITLPKMNYSSDLRSLTIERIQRECDTAITYSKYLSRTASSNSNAQLAVIRSSVYSIQVLNETYASMEGTGTHLIQETVLTSILTVIDNYYTRLTTGTNTSDNQTDLSNQLDQLQALADALQ